MVHMSCFSDVEILKYPSNNLLGENSTSYFLDRGFMRVGSFQPGSANRLATSLILSSHEETLLPFTETSAEVVKLE